MQGTHTTPKEKCIKSVPNGDCDVSSDLFHPAPIERCLSTDLLVIFRFHAAKYHATELLKPLHEKKIGYNCLKNSNNRIYIPHISTQ